jgi:hypothetical protein
MRPRTLFFVIYCVLGVNIALGEGMEGLFQARIEPPADGQNATPAIRRAIEQATEAFRSGRFAGAEVILAAGEYPLEGVEDEFALVRIDGADHLVIRGQGDQTRLVVRDHAPNQAGLLRKVFFIHDTRELILRDLVVDFAPEARDWLAGIARQVIVDETGKVTFDLELDRASPPFRAGVFATPTSGCIGMALNEAGQPREDFPEYFPVLEVWPAQGSLRVRCGQWGLADAKAFLESQRVVLMRRKPGEALFCFTGGNVHPTLRNLRIVGSRGMMIEAYGCDRLELDRLRMERADGQWLVSPGDGVHYQGGLSGPFIHDSHFEGLGDDAIHLYAKPFAISTAAQGELRYDSAAIPLKVGDRLWVYANAAPGGGRLITIRRLWKDGLFGELAFPAGFVADRAINLSRSGEGFVIRDNTFGPSRGIGCRIQTGQGLIEANAFTHLSGAAISFESGLGETFDEGPFAYDVTVKGNHFDHCATAAGYGRQAVRRMVRWNPDKADGHPAFRNLKLIDNTVAGGSTLPDGG